MTLTNFLKKNQFKHLFFQLMNMRDAAVQCGNDEQKLLDEGDLLKCPPSPTSEGKLLLWN